MIVVTLPYSSKYSKNFRPPRRGGRVFVPHEQKLARARLATELIPHRRSFFPGRRTYLGIILHRTHTRTDPQNLTPMIADAVAEGIQVDDCHYTIVSWPVDISKKTSAAFITIWVTQERSEYLQAIASESVAEIQELASTCAPLVKLH